MMITVRLWFFLACSIFLCSCWGLPDNFSSLSLEGKVKAYERRLRMGGLSSSEAQSQISLHGRPAAQRMIPFLQGTETGLSREDALTIIWDVQTRGCDLRGTEAERAVTALLARGDLSVGEKDTAQRVLESIAKNQHLAPGQLDSLKDGPCEKEYLENNRGR